MSADSLSLSPAASVTPSTSVCWNALPHSASSIRGDVHVHGVTAEDRYKNLRTTSILPVFGKIDKIW
jgi:hypothetical protein